MEDEANLEQEFVVDLIKQLAPALDVENLKEAKYKTMANGIIRQLKDETGIRDIFVINNEEDFTEYVNVSKSKKIDDLKKVQARLENNINGNTKSLEKVKSRLFLLENQMSISDLSVKEV
jgi:hypothetical protein